jgi:hypothetical protein
MSAFNVLGFFQLKGGRRVPTQKANTAYTVWHIHYSTRIHCGDRDATAIAVELRQYSSSTSETMPDGTVVFALCKAQALPNSTISMDAVNFIPIPSDPSLDAYDVSSYSLSYFTPPTDVPFSRIIYQMKSCLSFLQLAMLLALWKFSTMAIHPTPSLLQSVTMLEELTKRAQFSM